MPRNLRPPLIPSPHARALHRGGSALALLSLALLGCSSVASVEGEIAPREALATVLVLADGEVIDEVRPNRRTGRFALALDAGTYDFVVSADGFLSNEQHEAVEVVAGETLDLGTLILFRAGTGSIAGQVEPADASARVTAQQFGATIAAADVEAGGYLLVGLPTGTYDLVVTAPGFARYSSAEGVVVREGETAMVDPITLEPSAAETGSIVGGVSPPEAEVTVTAEQGGLDLASATAVDGRFELSGLEVGPYTLRFEADGFASAERPDVEVLADEATDIGEVALTPPARLIRGRVVDLDTGSPVPGVTVRVLEWSDTTDGQGRFSIPDLAAGEHTLWLDRPFYVPSAHPVSIPATGEVEVEYEMAAAGRVQGVLRDQNGPVAGGLVSIGPIRSMTNTRGEFALIHVRPGIWSLTGAADGYSPAGESIEIGAGEVVTQDLLLPATGTVTGLVRNDALEPLQYIRVSCQGREAITGADGTFTLSLVPVGACVLRAEYALHITVVTEVTVPDGGSAHVNLFMQERQGVTVTITGTVTRADTGEPVLAWLAYFCGGSNPNTSSDPATGAYALSSNFFSRVCDELRVSAPGFVPYRTEIDFDEPQPFVHDVQLIPYAALHGVVLDATTAEPVVGETITCNGLSEVLDATGRFTFGQIAPGAFDCALTNGDRCHVLALNEAPLRMAETRSVTLSAREYGSVLVHSRDASTAGLDSLADVQVEGLRRALTTDSSGSAQLTCVPPDAYSLVGWRQGYSSASAIVSVPLEQPVDVWLDLSPVGE